MFGSVRLVQEVTRSNQAIAPSPSTDTESHLESFNSSLTESSAISNTTPITTEISIVDSTNKKKLTDNQDLTRATVHPMSSPNEENVQQTERKKHESKQKKLYSQPTSSTLSIPIKPTSSVHSTKSREHRPLFFNTPVQQPLMAKTHARKNSKYSKRHYRARQASFSSVRKHHTRAEEEKKGKSHKLLCLWPLPIATRYMILIALLLSFLRSLHLVSLSCAAPSLVIYRLNLKHLILSPFLFDWTLPSVALYGWNLLILGLFEESLAHMIGGTRRFFSLLLVLLTTVSTLRLGLGYLFTKSTGWAVPSLFFSNAMHECNQGLAPFLFSLLVVQSLCIDDKYILIYGPNESNHTLTLRKVSLQLAMTLVNYTTQNILWWSLSGLLAGFLITLCLQALLAYEKREDSVRVKEVSEFISLERYRRTPLWRLMWSTVKKSAGVVAITLPILMTWNAYYTRDIPITPAELAQVSQERYLFTLVFMTAPRRGDPAYLTRTIDSYLANWPENPPAHSPYHRMQAMVYTHFSHHAQYDLARAHFSSTVKGQRYLKWVREDGRELNQRLHVAKALQLATQQFESTYYALMEDDFPVCGPHAWHEIEKVIYKAQKNVPHHCGIFVGTGGSGLFLKPEVARLVSRLLLHYVDRPPDIIIQQCLLGELPECSTCSDSLVTSKTLLMYHIGYNTSTSEDRTYKKNEFQCGWRHPFNGDPNVITL
ncbi:hypothetical protein G6F43_008844 [Rhizopus delemar]|nr:hypothetical protein G6F43_008844 [Rhizopus delemar]